MKQGITTQFVKKGAKSYLEVTLKNSAELQKYCIDTAIQNTIPGLLLIGQSLENGVRTLDYDITNKTTISQAFNDAQNAEAVPHILRFIADILCGLPEYFLHPSQCLLDWDYIFVDSKKQVGFALVPLTTDKDDGDLQVQALFKQILGGSAAQKNAVQYEGLKRVLDNPNFYLAELNSYFKDLSNTKLNNEPKMAVSPSANVLNQTKPTAPLSVENGADINPGFMIPGGGMVASPGGKTRKSPKVKEPQKPKEHHLGLFKGKKKSKELQLDGDVHIISGGEEAQKELPASKDTRPWQGTAPFHIDPEALFVTNIPFPVTEPVRDDDEDTRDVLIYQGREIPLRRFPFTVGRERCSLIIHNPTISQPHITIRKNNGTYYVEDEDSLNHTYINGTMIKPHEPMPLTDGAELLLARERLVLRMGNDK